MKIEKIIKILLIFGIIYLLLNSFCTENFATDTENIPKKIRLALLSNGKIYRFVSFLDLKNEYKMLLLKDMYEQSKTELDKNNTFLFFGGREDYLVDLFVKTEADIVDKIATAIINAKEYPDLANIIKEAIAKADSEAIAKAIAKAKANSALADIILKVEAEAKAYSDIIIKDKLANINEDRIGKMPIIIIDNDNFNEYTNTTNTTNIIEFNEPDEISEYGLLVVPTRSKYLFWNPNHNMLFSSTSNVKIKFEIKGKTKTNNGKNKFEIESIINKKNKEDKEDITPTRLVEKTIKNGDLSLKHYVLSNNDNEGKLFIWSWYTNNNLSNIL